MCESEVFTKRIPILGLLSIIIGLVYGGVALGPAAGVILP